MALNIHIITAALPPKLDGIGDYTARLATELAKTETVKILTTEGNSYASIPDVTIVPVFKVEQTRSVRQITRYVSNDRPDWLLLQYNPFSYGKWGLNPHLPLTLYTIKRHWPQVRVALMVHEQFVPVISWQFAIMTTWQRWQWWMLGRAADVIFCSCEAWERQARRWFPKTPVRHLPVGSSVPLVPITRIEARARLGIEEDILTLGLFGTAHISRMPGLVRRAAEAVCHAGKNVLVLYIGPDGQAIRQALGSVPTMADGPLPTEEISRRFAAMDICMAPFTDGVSTRRTSFMTGLQHGIATVGTSGVHTDQILKTETGRAFLLADVNSPKQFCTHVLRLNEDVSLRESLGRAGQEMYSREFAWEPVAAHLLAECRRVVSEE